MGVVTVGPRMSWVSMLGGLVGMWACIAAAAPAAEPAAGKLVAHHEPGWAQWRGPRRDAVSDETALLQSWPEGGPRLLWAASDLGNGYSSPVFDAQSIYITGDVGEQLVIFALSLDGAVRWKVPNGKSWKKPYPGARACCLYDAGRVYHMNAHGRTVCLDAATGNEVWAVEVFQRFEAKTPYFGAPECLLVDGRRLIVSPGGRKGLLAALDKQTGQTLWATDLLAEGEETAGYSSPILIEYGGRRQVIATSSHRTFAADAETGKALWSFPLRLTKSSTSTIPVFRRDSVFITNSSREECEFYRLRIDPGNGGAAKAWSMELSVGCGSVLCDGDRLFAAGRLKLKGWTCIDADSGQVRYGKDDAAIGSSIFADGRMYCLNENGTMLLVNPGAEAFETVGQFDLVKDKKDAWAHPVICNGRLYLRYHQKLSCYDVRGG